MGLLWDMFKRGISLDEAQIYLGELDKLWVVFSNSFDEKIEFKGIYLRKIKNCKQITIGMLPSSNDLWELCISYNRDDYDCYYRALYDVSKSSYIVKEGYDLSDEQQKSLKGYIFNSVKCVTLLNNKVSDIIIKNRNVPNTISVVSLNSGRLAVIYEGGLCNISSIRSLVRKNIENLEDSFYSNILSL